MQDVIQIQSDQRDRSFDDDAERSAGHREAWRSSEDSGFARVNISHTERLASVGVGAALTAAGFAWIPFRGLLAVLGGGALLYRGLRGHCHCYDALGVDTSERTLGTVIPAQQGEHAEKAVAIFSPPEELYAFWRDVKNLSQILPHVKEVTAEDQQFSHWVAEGPFGRELHWDAEIFNEREKELIAWRSLPGGDIETAGSIRFSPLAHGQGTEVKLALKYMPPGGRAGAMVASLSGYGLQHEITEALDRLKERFESGQKEQVND